MSRQALPPPEALAGLLDVSVEQVRSVLARPQGSQVILQQLHQREQQQQQAGGHFGPQQAGPEQQQLQQGRASRSPTPPPARPALGMPSIPPPGMPSIPPPVIPSVQQPQPRPAQPSYGPPRAQVSQAARPMMGAAAHMRPAMPGMMQASGTMQHPGMQGGARAPTPGLQHMPNEPRGPLGVPLRPPVQGSEAMRLVKREAMQNLVRRVAGNNAELKPDAELALMNVVEEMTKSAINFACGIASRRQGRAKEVQTADLAVYLERTRRLHVPGAEHENFASYKRPNTHEAHRAFAAAIRAAPSAGEQAGPAAMDEAQPAVKRPKI